LPSGLSINPSTGVTSGTMTGAAKTYSVSVSVKDGLGATTS
jgi:Putative Ig domain